MKIKKTIFTTEIEITPQEIQDLYQKIHPNSNVWEWLCKTLGIMLNVQKHEN